MGSCVRHFLCLYHSDAFFLRYQGGPLSSSFIELAQQILRSPLVLSLFLVGTLFVPTEYLPSE